MKKVLIECAPRNPFTILESAASPATNTSYRLKGVFQNYEDVNLNNRKYPRSIWENHLTEGSDFHGKMTSGIVLGHIEHPESGLTDLNEVAIRILEARIATPEEIAESNGALKSGDVVGVLDILETPKGKVLRALTDAKIPWGVSSRGSGSIEESADCDVVADDFVLETWDAVFSPSVARAIPQLTESVTKPGPALTESVSKLDSAWTPAAPAPKTPSATPPAPTPPAPVAESAPVPPPPPPPPHPHPFPVPSTTKARNIKHHRSCRKSTKPNNCVPASRAWSLRSKPPGRNSPSPRSPPSPTTLRSASTVSARPNTPIRP